MCQILPFIWIEYFAIEIVALRILNISPPLRAKIVVLKLVSRQRSV